MKKENSPATVCPDRKARCLQGSLRHFPCPRTQRLMQADVPCFPLWGGQMQELWWETVLQQLSSISSLHQVPESTRSTARYTEVTCASRALIREEGTNDGNHKQASTGSGLNAGRLGNRTGAQDPGTQPVTSKLREERREDLKETPANTRIEELRPLPRNCGARDRSRDSQGSYKRAQGVFTRVSQQSTLKRSWSTHSQHRLQ